jgi:hypothetical protein
MLIVTSPVAYFNVWSTLNEILDDKSKASSDYCSAFSNFLGSQKITHFDIMLLIKHNLPPRPDQPGDFRFVEELTVCSLCDPSSLVLAPWACRVGIYLSVLCVLVNGLRDDTDCSALFEGISGLFIHLNSCLSSPYDQLETNIRSCYDALEHVNNTLTNLRCLPKAEVEAEEEAEEVVGPSMPVAMRGMAGFPTMVDVASRAGAPDNTF